MIERAAPNRPRMHLEDLLDRINAAVVAGDLTTAGRLAETAAPLMPPRAALLNLVAYVRVQEGRLAEAIDLLEQARRLSPGDIHVLNSLGLCLSDAGRPAEAVAMFDLALRQEARFAPAHFNKGSALSRLGQDEAARQAFEQAAALDPGYAAPLEELAFMAAQRGDYAGARGLAEKALRLDASCASAVLALAMADIAQDAPRRGLDRAQELVRREGLAPTNRAIALGIVGDAHDRLGETGPAFASYAAAKAELARLYAPDYAASGGRSYESRVRSLQRSFEAIGEMAPAVGEAAAPCDAHVFLVGFPRSGTTLLEQALAANPRAVTMDEQNALSTVIDPYFDGDEGLAAFNALSAPELDAMRERYWVEVRRSVPGVDGKVFIDKLPLNAPLLGFIARLFPSAKILFCLRDPRDVALSCFRHRFGMNAAMYAFCTLEGAAELYDAVMQLCELYRDKLPLDRLDVRYEDVVADFDGAIGRACDFLGIGFDPSMRDVAARVRTRAISTPSAAQLARGLYTDAAGQWRRYESELTPVRALLDPWAAKFGYAGA